MPTINQQQSGDPVEILFNYVQQDGWGIDPDTDSATGFTFRDLTPPSTLGSMAVTGSGLAYFPFEGQLVPIAGTVHSLKISSGFIIIGQPPYVPLEITGLNLSVSELFSAAQEGEQAVRDLFAEQQWIWNGSSGNDSFTGGNMADQLTGNDGNDTIRGGDGDDTIIGDDGLPAGDGNDTLFGDAGNDFMYGYGGNDSLSGGTGNDYMSGGTGNDAMNGNDGDDRLYGQAGTDSLYGGTGTDMLDGGAGIDTMSGGVGSDSYYVDNAGDKVIEANVPGVDKVYASVSYSISGQFIENLTLTGTGNINGTGNSLANIIAGNAGGNVINGGLGADTMSGGVGSDSYYVDNAGDKVIEANVPGVDKVYASVSYSISGQFIENLTLTGTGNINGTGNSLANIIAGNAGSNVINGGLGSDTLSGGAGADRFVFNTALGSANIDKITDFNVPQDAIWLDNAVFTALGATGLLAASAFHVGAAAHDANDRIVYNAATGALFYDSNGSAAGGAVQFATLGKGLAMSNADFLII